MFGILRIHTPPGKDQSGIWISDRNDLLIILIYFPYDLCGPQFLKSILHPLLHQCFNQFLHFIHD